MKYRNLLPLNNTNMSSLNNLTKELLNTLNGLDYDSLKELYKSSDKVIAEAMQANNEKNSYKTIEMFNGLVFKNLDYSSMNQDEKLYIDNSLLIFSALYGIVSSKGSISPYRLDLNNSLKPHIVNLTMQWKPYVNQYIDNLECDYVIDLASTEYRKLVNTDQLCKNYIRIDFKDVKDGKYKSMATFSKMARGQFVRQMALENTQRIEEIKKLSVMNYTFDEKLSSSREFVFSRMDMG
jgi:hypothetical protein